jgi:hypothetical protein
VKRLMPLTEGQILGRYILVWSVVPPFLVFTIALFLSSQNVLDSNESLRIWTNSMRSWFFELSPKIDIFRHADSTSYSQIARLSTSVAIVAMGWLAVGASVALFVAKGYEHFSRTMTVPLLISVVVSPFFGYLRFTSFIVYLVILVTVGGSRLSIDWVTTFSLF